MRRHRDARVYQFMEAASRCSSIKVEEEEEEEEEEEVFRECVYHYITYLSTGTTRSYSLLVTEGGGQTTNHLDDIIC